MKMKSVALMLLIGLVTLGITTTCINLTSPSAIQMNGPADLGTFVTVGNGTTSEPLGDPIDTPGMPT